MKKEPMKLSASDNSKICELMSNIESKLDMLARDDFEYEPELMNQSQNVSNWMASPKKSLFQPEDLANSRQSIPSSPVLSKISQMEENYLSKLTVLNQKVTILESQNSQLKDLSRGLQAELAEYKQRLGLLQQEQQRVLDGRIDELKQGMMVRLRDQVESQIEGYISELKQMRQEASLQRKHSKSLQSQLQMLTFQRDNYEQMYRQLMDKYKKIMKADIQGYEHQQLHKKHNENSNVEQTDSIVYEQRKDRKISEGGSRKKTGKKNREKGARVMAKEELIPFLTKGIEELKEKLKLK